MLTLCSLLLSFSSCYRCQRTERRSDDLTEFDGLAVGPVDVEVPDAPFSEREDRLDLGILQTQPQRLGVLKGRLDVRGVQRQWLMAPVVIGAGMPECWKSVVNAVMGVVILVSFRYSARARRSRAGGDG